MSDDDVYPGEMDTPQEFDDQAADALFSGSGRGTDPQFADLFDDMRIAYSSQPPAVGAELAAVIAVAEPTPEASPARRFERMRSSIIAKAGAATAAVFAATGGLAVAHALPASMQDAASEIGIGAPAGHGHHAHEAIEVEPRDSTTTTIEHETTTVPDHDKDAVDNEHDDNDRGAVVGDHQGDNNQDENECEADEQGEGANDGAVTSTSVPGVPTTGTTVPESHDGNQGDTLDDTEHSTVSTVPESHDGENATSGSAGSGSGSELHTTTPTTTSHSDGGDDSHSGSGDDGSSHGS
jgi:hypothetical protein